MFVSELIKTAFTLIGKYGPKVIYETYSDAKSHEKEKTKHAITLGTVFGTKGSEFDKVTILDDLNASITDVFEKTGKDIIDFSEDDIVTMNLYYVAASRAKRKLINAVHLPSLKSIK